MKLLHEFTEADITALVTALRIDAADYRRLILHRDNDPNAPADMRYAFAIIRARRALGMELGAAAMIDPPDTTIVDCCPRSLP